MPRSENQTNALCYPASSYDHEFCLKPPLILWMAVIFLARAILLPIAMGVGHFAGVSAEAMTAMRGFWSAETLIPSLLTLPVLYTLMRRVSTASEPVRWIWAHGRVFLSVSALTDLALSSALQMWRGTNDETLVMSLVVAAIDVYFLSYVLAARRVRDTFNDFPAAGPTTGSDNGQGIGR